MSIIRKGHSNLLQWCKAVDEEYDFKKVLILGMFGFLPDGKKIVGCKWMFKVKRIDGTFEQYKAHLVAKGFT